MTAHSVDWIKPVHNLLSTLRKIYVGKLYTYNMRVQPCVLKIVSINQISFHDGSIYRFNIGVEVSRGDFSDYQVAVVCSIMESKLNHEWKTYFNIGEEFIKITICR